MSHFKGPDVEEALPNFRLHTSVLNLLEGALRHNGDAIGMVEGQTQKKATYKEFLQQSTSISSGLRKEGVTAGEYVIMCCDKSIAAYSALLGVIFTGATAILYPIPHADSIHKMTKGFTIKAVFCDVAQLEPIKKSLSQMIQPPTLVVTTDTADEDFQSLLQTEEEFQMFQVQDATRHVPMMFFSSGTTGDPKGVMISDTYVQMCGHYFSFDIRSFLVGSPMYWVSALTAFVSSIFNKYTLVFSNSSDPQDNLRLIDMYGIEGWITGTGTMPRYITEPTLHKFDLSSLKIVTTGGEYLLSSTYNKFNEKVLKNKLKLVNGYGSTEGGLMAILLPKYQYDDFTVGLCGPLYPGVEIKILDQDSNLVPVGSLGEVYLKSKALTPGYWGRPDLTSEAFDNEGFLKTGDAGIFDQRGFLHLRGRMMDLIEFRCRKISPAEVEDVLMSHPAVLDAAVVGKPHPTDTQHMTAYVVRKRGVAISEMELSAFVDGKVEDSLKLRGGVHFLEVLPRTIIGKVQRKLLKEL